MIEPTPQLGAPPYFEDLGARLLRPDGTRQDKFEDLDMKFCIRVFSVLALRGRGPAEVQSMPLSLVDTEVRNLLFFGLGCEGRTPLPVTHDNAGFENPLFLVLIALYDSCGRPFRRLDEDGLKRIGYFDLLVAPHFGSVLFSRQGKVVSLGLTEAQIALAAEDSEIVDNLHAELAAVRSVKAGFTIRIAPLFEREHNVDFSFLRDGFEFPEAAAPLRYMTPNAALASASFSSGALGAAAAAQPTGSTEAEARPGLLASARHPRRPQRPVPEVVASPPPEDPEIGSRSHRSSPV